MEEFLNKVGNNFALTYEQPGGMNFEEREKRIAEEKAECQRMGKEAEIETEEIVKQNNRSNVIGNRQMYYIIYRGGSDREEVKELTGYQR
jgi:hypothetical protein